MTGCMLIAYGSLWVCSLTYHASHVDVAGCLLVAPLQTLLKEDELDEED